jgi:adenylate kinase (isozyme 1 subfamily)
MSCFGCCGEYLDEEDKKEKETGTEAGEVEPQVSEDVQIVFVLGGPGSGKGTQCDLIKEKYGFGHFSAGDLLRAEVESGSEVGKSVEATMKEGKLVSSAVTIQLLKKAIANSDKKQILVDGFPRALDQAQEFEDKVIPCKLVLFFDCPQKVLQKRLMKRAKTSGRADDNAETIKKRFDTFNNTSMPVITHYEKANKVARVSAASAPKDIFVKVCKVLSENGFEPAA